MSNLDLKDIPIIDAVQVLRYRTNPETGVLEPWPVATCEIDRAGRVIWRGDAGRAYEPLLRATKKSWRGARPSNHRRNLGRSRIKKGGRR